MPRILKRPPPKLLKPKDDHEVQAVLDEVAVRAEEIAELRQRIDQLAESQKVDFLFLRDRKVSLRTIAAAARVRPQTILNQITK